MAVLSLEFPVMSESGTGFTHNSVLNIQNAKGWRRTHLERAGYQGRSALGVFQRLFQKIRSFFEFSADVLKLQRLFQIFSDLLK
jgi:hypothetical protein